MSLKNAVTPPGIDPGTIRLVTQLLNHYATPRPRDRNIIHVFRIGITRGRREVVTLQAAHISLS